MKLAKDEAIFALPFLPSEAQTRKDDVILFCMNDVTLTREV
jgi:hypothetical protein